MRKCDEVAALTNDMLLHSVSDLDRLKMQPEDIELCGFLTEAVGGLSARNNIRLDLPAYPVRVSADRNRLLQAVGNGAGLGLYIVKYIVTRSGGEVFAENLSDGFRIKIILPVIS